MNRKHTFYSVIIVAILALVACGEGGGIISGIVTPTPFGVATPYPITPTPFRPQVTIQFCNDDSAAYTRQDFNNANAIVAQNLIQAVSANQGGVTLFATAMTHDPFEQSNTLPAFQIPATPAYSVAPTLIPQPVVDNPVEKTATSIANDNQNNTAITSYNQTITAGVGVVDSLKAKMTKDVQTLTSWNPPVDDSVSSIWGCLELANDNFKPFSGKKIIWIVSDMENLTTSCADCNDSFIPRHGLQDDIVHIYFLPTTTASHDHYLRTRWCPLLKAAVASSITFDNPASSSIQTNWLTTDINRSPGPCLGI